ncbi:hypothetical protein MHYP_G00292610 [Metynnis hypsauchen]
MCDVVNEIELERERCENKTAGNFTSGCKGMWDIIACWPSAKVGEMVVIPCPNYFSYFSEHHSEGGLYLMEKSLLTVPCAKYLTSLINLYYSYV